MALAYQGHPKFETYYTTRHCDALTNDEHRIRKNNSNSSMVLSDRSCRNIMKYVKITPNLGCWAGTDCRTSMSMYMYMYVWCM